jgi:hypothetical protein
MKNISINIVIAVAILLMLAQTLFAAEVHTRGKVCGDLQVKCLMPPEAVKNYQPFDLAFNMPQKIDWQNNYYSDHFYAVMLKSKKAKPDDGPASDIKCSGFFNEQERAKLQSDFNGNKVFASRTGCSGQMFHYTGYNTQYNFVAVYGGSSKGDADSVLKKAKSLGYKDANIRKMQAVFAFGD